MFKLMDRVQGGVDPMIQSLESYIVTTGLDDMMAAAETITTVRSLKEYYVCIVLNVCVVLYIISVDVRFRG